jgi:hypothetical protein
MTVKMIHYPPAMGLRPRPASDYDILCARYYRAVENRNYHATLVYQERLAAMFPGERLSDVLDDAYSSGSTLAACRIG